MKKENKIILTALLVAAFIGAGIYFGLRDREVPANAECSNIPPLKNNAVKEVIEVVDGDTVVINGDYSVRLLGIDADEKGGYCYETAKSRLEDLVLNKKIRLVKNEEDLDKYCRYLRYIFIDNQDVGLTLIKEGRAETHFYSDTSKFYSDYIEAEELARNQGTGCEWSAGKYEANQIESNAEPNQALNWETLTAEQTNLEIIPACQANNYIGKNVIVEGITVDTYRSRTNTVFLNFGATYPNHCFTAVIFQSDQHRFPAKPEDLYKDKTVRIIGRIKMYEGKPEIILERKGQIEIGK